ncbi:hypothetical protein BH23ACT10_BH23ACT10_25430 [soil metagenome]
MGTQTANTVLVVDDERPLVGLVGTYLKREGFQVVEAFDGRQALDAARAEEPDVIVLDLMLPGIDGLEVARQVRTFSDAYIIMLTARAEEIDLVVGLSERPRVVLSRGQLLDRLRGSPEYRDEHVVDVHVANVRRKLAAPDVIVTVRGAGYRMGAPS